MVYARVICYIMTVQYVSKRQASITQYAWYSLLIKVILLDVMILPLRKTVFSLWTIVYFFDLHLLISALVKLLFVILFISGVFLFYFDILFLVPFLILPHVIYIVPVLF